MQRTLDTGITTEFEDRGEGLPLLLIHGFPHNRSLWDDQIRGLAPHVRCIAPDIRGFGESTVSGPYSIPQYAEDMAALLGSLGIERAVVAGLSMGGYIALQLWREHPEVCRALVLLDTQAGADSPEGRAKRDERIAQVRESGMQGIVDSVLPGMLGKTTRDSDAAKVQRVREMLLAAPAEGVAGALQAMRDRIDSAPILGTISVPTLVVVGDEDVLTPPREAARLHAGIAGSELFVIPGAGHLSNLEQPEVVNGALLKFIRSLEDR